MFRRVAFLRSFASGGPHTAGAPGRSTAAGRAGGGKEPELSLRAVLAIMVTVVLLCICVLTLKSPKHVVPPPYIPHASQGTPALIHVPRPNITVASPLPSENFMPRPLTLARTTVEPKGTTKPTSRPPASKSRGDLKIVLFTTVKPCDRDSIFDAQVAAVASWAALPLPVQPVVYIIDTEQRITDSPQRTCAQLIADLVPTAKDLVSPVATSAHGTVLLGSAIHLIKTLEPDADVIGFVNADILLAPHSVDALLGAYRTFTDFFIVGRRRTVDLRSEATREALMPRVVASRKGRRPPPREHTADRDPFRLSAVFDHRMFQAATGDRIDAEDYFFFTRHFFDALSYEVPDFHIGRPAYDNWFVHTAVHTLQPVIDGSGFIEAFHQAHDYHHLSKDRAGEGKPNGSNKNKGWSYWGSADQKVNYDLALAHGGWRHGLIEFAPLRFLDTPGGSVTVTLKPTWKTLGNDDNLADEDAVVLSDLGKYLDKLMLNVKPETRPEWKQGLRNVLKLRKETPS